MPSRRDVLATGALLGVSTLTAGCTALRDDDTPTSESATETTPDSPVSPGDPATDRSTTEPAAEPSTLTVATTGGLSEPLMHAAALWNANREPETNEYGRSFLPDLDTDGLGMADYFASRHGLEPTEHAQDPPFRVAVGTGGQAQAREALADKRVKMAALGGEVFDPLSERMVIPDSFVRHDCFRMGTAIVVSEAVVAGGLEAVTPAQLRDIYTDRIQNWATVGGPDRDIHVVTTVNTSPPSRFERTFLADRDTVADEVIADPDRRAGIVAERDDTVTRFRVPDVETLGAGGTDGYRFLRVEVDGEPRGPGGEGYPGNYPLPLFTNGEPGPRERAFLDALTTSGLQPWMLRPERDEPLYVLPAEQPPEF